VAAASKHALERTESLILATSVAILMLAMTAIGATSAAGRHLSPVDVLRTVAIASATVAIGLTGRFTAPVALIATLASLCAAQLALSLAGRNAALKYDALYQLPLIVAESDRLSST
jgi:steroid 5-alpha reductase family enzyme